MATKFIIGNTTKAVLPGGKKAKNWKTETEVFNHRDEKRAFVPLTIAENRRDRDGEDLDPLFQEVKVFGYLAKHIGETGLPKGSRVIAFVREVPAKEKTVVLIEDKDGNEREIERTDVELHAIDLGASFSYATVEVEKAEKSEKSSRSSRSSRRSRDEDAEDQADEETNEDEEETPRRARSTRSRAKAEPAEDEGGEEEAPAPRRRRSSY